MSASGILLIHHCEKTCSKALRSILSLLEVSFINKKEKKKEKKEIQTKYNCAVQLHLLMPLDTIFSDVPGIIGHFGSFNITQQLFSISGPGTTTGP